GMLAVQGATGLFASDDVITEGPLAALVSAKTVALLSSLHRLGFKALLGLILLHLGAIAFYRWVKKEDLVRPMLTGTKPMPPGTPGVVFVSPWRALVVAVVAAGLVFGGLRLAG
ncbi:MAG: cytochrome b/b6 domain-containing protein, partial [Magnetospirillum sp.]|nr:cytochrome b/b6 domain-containing protein [Magnetospirillum sp.]